MPIKIDATPRDANAVVLKIKGSLTDFEGRALLDAIDEQLRQFRNRIVIDLSELEFMNSLGLAALLTVFTRVSNAGGRLAITNANGGVDQLLRTTQLYSLIVPYHSVEAALARIR
jgi:anti-sigma B factor antagonist